ncbi:MerR family transcriptional regulator [Fulvivirgaceae bacterium BMA10]|uniref:MerR family transcriptional regulator n=1 Tax=Splendidivirga corallicola TaxID=3051826 RepID=A0ABT8KU79_9BACT|nr:MerR family transcriptional regulator [Fulvivirgaceae bacterium BMA10]
MTSYSVKQLSKLAGVSVRTLHHYDRIGLLKPAFRSEKGYRYYGRTELLTLQQILFYKELDFPLKEIAAIMNDTSFDLLTALEFHKQELKKRSDRLEKLLATIDKTIVELKNKNEMMTDKEIYEGFSEEEVRAMKQEVAERWGEEQLTESEERIRKLGKDGWKDTKEKGEEINQLLADLMDLQPSDERVQKAIALHHQYMNTFYEVSKEGYRGLGKMYVEDARFTAYYEKYRKGLAMFIHQAIEVYADSEIKMGE